VLLRSDIGEFNMGFTRDGSYFYGTGNVKADSYLAEVDLQTLHITKPPSKLTERFVGANGRPAWSADGRQIAFVRGTQSVALVIRSAVDGTEKTLPTVFGKGGATFGPEWFPDGRSLRWAKPTTPTSGAVFRRVDVVTAACGGGCAVSR
jgi:Tol biopolymer transport system component